MKHKLRASFSLLSAWRRGQYEQAINSYLHLGTPTSKAMDEGTALHLKAQENVEAHRKLPDEFLGIELTNPTCEFEANVPYDEICDLHGYFDVIDGNTLIELKTGSSSDSGDYVLDFQVAMYLLMCDMLKLPVDKAIIVHYNQHTGKTDSSIVWKSEQELQRAKNFINTLVPEIYQYFEDNGIFEREEKLNLDKQHKIV